MRKLYIGYQTSEWSETFYTDVKTIKNAKKQPVSKKEDGRFQG